MFSIYLILLWKVSLGGSDRSRNRHVQTYWIIPIFIGLVQVVQLQEMGGKVNFTQGSIKMILLSCFVLFGVNGCTGDGFLGASGHSTGNSNDGGNGASPDDGEHWQALPLRSPSQMDQGLEGGEGFQMIQSMAYAPSNPQTVYLLVDTSQVWKSTDGGNSWVSKRKGFQSYGGVAISVDPKNENVVFASGSLPTGSSPVDGIYRTVDGGENWSLVKQTYFSKLEDGFDYCQGQHYVFDPTSFDGTRHTTIFAASHKEGLLRTLDGGESWESIGLANVRIVDLDSAWIDQKMVLYAATGSGLYKIENLQNAPASLTKIGNGLNLDSNYPRSIAVDSSNDSTSPTIYVAMGKDKVYRSTDGGLNFVQTSNLGLPDNVIYQIIEISTSSTPKRLYLRAHLYGGFNPYYSTAGGETWSAPKDLDLDLLSTKSTGTGRGNTYHGTPVVPHPSQPNVALANLNNTIMRTSDGGVNWSYSGNGYKGGRRAINKTAAFFDRNNPLHKIFFLIDHGPIETLDGGLSWRLIDVPRNGSQTTPVAAVDPENSQLIITAVGEWESQFLIRSEDGGKSWTQFPTYSENFQYMAFDLVDPHTVVAAGKTISYTNWIPRQSRGV